MLKSNKPQKEGSVHNDTSVLLFDHKLVAFSCKEATLTKGQYRFPFAFRLPSSIPGSFKFVNKKERVLIKYTVEVYMEKGHDVMSHKKEVMIREFLFTEEEIDQDWKNYEKIINLKNVLKPTSTFA